ncbi:metallophosphoesterase family protein [Aquimarina agarivorans]|uniref:metallophosphoesterase family protein n=1 Tax=Aquimarina agarivorans TaxID=980584 RepID=UPI000248EC3D|nr:metallophosphoesterase family protein [Aquimarina agarivorans]
MLTNRTFAIGDIHGGLKALQQLLSELRLTPEDHLIFLGDYVDGWSQSAETIFFLMELSTKYQCTFVRGNHDELCFQWLKTKNHTDQWLIHGGQATKDSYAKFTAKEIETQFDFFDSLQNYVILNENKLFLHAGFTNLHGPHKEYFEKLFYWDRTLWELALSVDPKLKKDHILYPKRLTLFDEVYIGHTPVSRINKTTPVNAACVWNVDTGAAFKGPLTAIDIESKAVFQSDPVHTFYPDERGRN